MIIKNAEVEELFNFLISFELTGKDSRLRTRFCKILMDRKQLIDEEHVSLIKEFDGYNEDGTPKVVFDKTLNKNIYDLSDRNGFQREYAELLQEDFVIEENEERKEILLKVREIILECDKTFRGREALEYDRWCEIVEQIKYNTEE